MQLSAVLIEIGHPVAYYPRLTKITGSVTSGILLCQLLYWVGKQRNPEGWIYKTQSEIEDETGLNRTEQESARKQLKSAGLLEERYTGLPRRLEYRVVTQEVDSQWMNFVETGTSPAMEDRRMEGKKRLERMNKKGCNPRGCQNVLQVQAMVNSEDTLASTLSAGILYTETTPESTNPKTNSKVLQLKRIENPQAQKKERGEGESGNQERESLTHLTYLADEREKQTRSIGVETEVDQRVPLSSRDAKTKALCTIDEDGWIKLPEAEKYNLPRAIAVRRMQSLLAIDTLSDTAELMVDESGERFQRSSSGKLGIHLVKDDLYQWEDEAFKPDGVLSLKALRSYAHAQGLITQNGFNEVMEWMFEHSIAWCKYQGKKATEILKSNSVLDLFYQNDKGTTFPY